MTILLTGATGYIGSYVANELLTRTDDRIAVLVRAKSEAEGQQRLWKSMQLHMDFDRFAAALPRFDIYLGDLTVDGLGLRPDARARLVDTMRSVIHCAASLNRKSDKVCFNVNLRGTLELIKLAREAQDAHGLRRFSDVSTVAVAGHRNAEVVQEDAAIEWDRSDYDPYARTKKFCEHMVHELLPEVPSTIFRPSIVLGDSRFPETTQFDMVRAFAALAVMRVLPLRREWRVDIVPANYVGEAIARIHIDPSPKHGIYHLSSGEGSLTYGEVVDGLRRAGHRARSVFLPQLEKPFALAVEGLMATPRKYGLSPAASLMKVFLPYLTYDTVFDNRRVIEALGHVPAPFTDYAYPLLRFAVDGKYRYPYREWPADAEARLARASKAGAGVTRVAMSPEQGI
ncbi:MAG: SDR family oxidoreductase [Deltaproteobacteria bacterium]|nr:SDR family oxidoreductase [Deltaproteobacteria bacterium]MBK8240888.1 SDR family oxidoreductase [Deltaproteobacteria bacterium]MBK8714110.1 SDR family oxidoreductase [Deltaproteobacteria bacterium]MBP7285637.1 SDR family oxidoreductase [Nannocystaceae bacterium]